MAVNFSTGGGLEFFSSANVQAGTVIVDMYASNQNSRTYSFKMLSLPKLSQDFDARKSMDDLSQLRVGLSSISFEIFDEIGFTAIGQSGTYTAYDSFYQKIQGLEDESLITIVVTVNNKSDYFLSSKSSVEYDWESRSCKISGWAVLKYDTEVTNYSLAPIRQANTNAGDESFALAGDVISSYLNCQGSSPDVYIRSNYFNDSNFVNGEIVPGFKALAGSEYVTSYGMAQQKVLQMAILENAIIGSMMGYSFYTIRSYNGTLTYNGLSPRATITANDIETFSITPHLENVNSYITNFAVYNNDSTDEKLEDVQQGNVRTAYGNGSVDINISQFMECDFYEYEDVTFPPFDWTKVEGASLNSTIQFFNEEPLNNTSYTRLDQYARDSYAQTFGVSLPSNYPSYVGSYKVSFTVLGIDKVLPFQYVFLDDLDLPLAIRGLKIRPSYIEYNLQENKIEIEGYPI